MTKRSDMPHWTVNWIDSGREPKCPADPDYPNGIDLNVAQDRKPACQLYLTYPAKRIGRYEIKCNRCGVQVACTTAGRPDDPRSIKIPCNRN